MGVQQSSPISQESGHLNHLAIKKPNGMLLIMIVKASISKENETGCSGLEHWDDPEGCDGEGGGREDREVEGGSGCGTQVHS